MTSKRITKHMAISIGVFERMDDETLIKCFVNKGTTKQLRKKLVKELRESLVEYRSQGFEFVPCNCGNYDATGACKGAA